MKRVKWAAAAAAAGAALLFVVALVEVVVLLLPAASGAHVYGTSDADTRRRPSFARRSESWEPETSDYAYL